MQAKQELPGASSFRRDFMTRRTIYIIFAAVVLIALVALLWIWLLGRGTPTPSNNGTFGTASTTNSTTGVGVGGSLNNIPGAVNGNPNDGSQAGSGNLGNPVVGGTIGVGGTISPGVGINTTGADWLAGNTSGSGSVGGGLGSNFNPKSINQLNDGNVSGQPTILGNTISTGGNGSNSGIGLEGALIGVGIGTALCTAGLLGTPIGLASTGASAGVAAATKVAAVPVSDTGTQVILGVQLGTSNAIAGSQAVKSTFLDCITRTIAKAALQQITASVVNWINSGFNGSPSFVTNYKQFFQNVADQAAGEYIKGSALSFLCSPFQLQIRIAIAQSYANRNAAASCSLSKVVGNINSFMGGNFSQGGWPGLIQFTTVPTNNPYGAFAYAQAGLQTAQSNANQNANRNMTATGFLNFQQAYDCKTAAAPSNDGNGQATQYDCKYKTVTPGSVIESSLSKTLNVSQDTLVQAGVSGSFDAIINALISQLTTRALYSGLTNLSGNSGYQTNYLTPAQQQAQDQARTLMTAMQADVTLAQQYGTAEQGSIQDIQNAQQQLSSVYACWINWTGGAVSSDKQALAASRATAASTTLISLDTQIDSYNANILRANTAITVLQGLQTNALNVASLADVQTLTNSYTQAKAAGQLLTQADVVSAQQDRTTLQANLASINANTTSQFNQCNAFGN